MTFNHEAVAALPNGGNAVASLIRSMAEKRFAYCLDTSENAADFVAVDPVSGVLPQMLFQNNIAFLLDPTDSTTTADGVTCLVTSDGKRYKSGSIAPPYSVLSRTVTAQPGSPSVGDDYIIPTAATGTDWSGKDGTIGIFGPRGWQFAVSPIGREIYVKDVDAFYHKNAGGTWVGGVGSISIGAGAINLTNVIEAAASYVIKVENQTTNAPPASPITPTAYIIGPSPTGAWAGNAGKLAICLTAGTFTIISPVAGDSIYDKAQANTFRFNGTAWVSAAGAWLSFQSVFTASGSTSSGGGTDYTYSPTTAPTNSGALMSDGVGLNHTALKSGATLRIKYRARLTTNTIPANGGGAYTIALFRDSISTALAWEAVPFGTIGAGSSLSLHVDFEAIVTAPDTSVHTYEMIAFSAGSGLDITALDRRLLTIEEAA